MNDKDYVEIKSYFKETLSKFKQLRIVAQAKKKTLKSKAANSVIDLIVMRLEGLLAVLTVGNPNDITLELTIQKQLYNPILEYWESEFIEKSKNEKD